MSFLKQDRFKTKTAAAKYYAPKWGKSYRTILEWDKKGKVPKTHSERVRLVVYRQRVKVVKADYGVDNLTDAKPFKDLESEMAKSSGYFSLNPYLNTSPIDVDGIDLELSDLISTMPPNLKLNVNNGQIKIKINFTNDNGDEDSGEFHTTATYTNLFDALDGFVKDINEVKKGGEKEARDGTIRIYGKIVSITPLNGAFIWVSYGLTMKEFSLGASPSV